MRDPVGDLLNAYEDMQVKYDHLCEVAAALYMAGYWTCDRPVDSMKLWQDLRDAAGIPPGNSPSPRVTV